LKSIINYVFVIFFPLITWKHNKLIWFYTDHNKLFLTNIDGSLRIWLYIGSLEFFFFLVNYFFLETGIFYVGNLDFILIIITLFEKHNKLINLYSMLFFKKIFSISKIILIIWKNNKLFWFITNIDWSLSPLEFWVFFG
jgi:hypothetical protein